MSISFISTKNIIVDFNNKAISKTYNAYDNANTYTFNQSQSFSKTINNDDYATIDNKFVAKEYRFENWALVLAQCANIYRFYGYDSSNGVYWANQWGSHETGKTLTQYTGQYSTQTKINKFATYSNSINIPNSTFGRDYQIVFNFNNGKKLTINSNSSLSGSIDLVIKNDSFDGDNLQINHNYGKSGGAGVKNFWPNHYGKNNMINRIVKCKKGYWNDIIGYIDIPNYRNSKNDSFILRCNYDVQINGSNISYTLNMNSVTGNDGNQNSYAYNNQTFSIALENVQIKPLGYNLINEDSFQSKINQVFNTPLSAVVDNISTLSQNKSAINKLIDERLNANASTLGYYYQNNYSNWFKWSVTSYNNNLNTITIKFDYKLFYTNNNSIDGWNSYSKDVNVNLTSSNKYYSEQIWERLLIGNTKISYDAQNGVTMQPSINLGVNNPWNMLNQQPYPQIAGSAVTYPDFGTWYINTNTRVSYYSLPNQNEDVKVNGQSLDSLNGQYSFLMIDPTTVNNQNTGSNSNEYLIEIYGNKNGSYGLLFKIKFIVKALYPTTDIKYRNWNPSAYPLDQWQASWITEVTDDTPNPDYMPNLNKDTGLAEQIIWVENENNLKVSPFDLAATGQNRLTFPDPVDQDGNLLYDLSEYFDENTNTTVDPSKLNISQELLDKIGYGFIAKGVVAPRGIEQSFNNSNLEVRRNDAFNDLSIDSSDGILINSNNQLDYLDKSGIYKYTTYDKVSKLYGSTYVIIGDQIGKKQTFSQYMNQINNKVVVQPFWETFHGNHLASYLRTEVNLSTKEIRALTVEQVQSWWAIYVKNAIFKAVNPTTKTYNLNDFPLSSIKANIDSADDLKKFVKSRIDNAMSSWAKKLNILDKDGNQISFVENQDYVIHAESGETFDNINWEALTLNTSQLNKLNLVISALSPNVYLTGQKTISVINSSQFQNIFELTGNQLNTLKENTTDPNKLKNDILKYINAQLIKISGNKEITKNDWYIVQDLDTIVQQLININQTTQTQEIELTINASENSTKLSGYCYLKVNNSINNPNIDVDDGGNVVDPSNPDKPVNPDNPNKPSNGGNGSNNEFLSKTENVIGLTFGLIILLGLIIAIAVVIVHKKRSSQFKSINLATNEEAIKETNNEPEINVDEIIEETNNEVEEVIEEELVDEIFDELADDYFSDAISDSATNEEKQKELDKKPVEIKEVIQKNLSDVEKLKQELDQLNFDQLQLTIIEIEKEIIRLQQIIKDKKGFVQTPEIIKEIGDLVYKKRTLIKGKEHIFRLVSQMELEGRDK